MNIKIIYRNCGKRKERTLQIMNKVNNLTIACMQEVNSAYMAIIVKDYCVFNEGRTVAISHKDLKGKKVW